MIAIHLNGRLGNQLFQYAFIYNQHKIHKTPFFLVKEGTPITLYKYFVLDKNQFYILDLIFFNHEGFKLFLSHYLRKLFYDVILNTTKLKILTSSNDSNPSEILNLTSDNTLYIGFFQSEEYFRESLSDLQHHFQIKKRFKKKFEAKFQSLFKQHPTTVVHIRKTDYRDLLHLELGGADLSLPITYFHSILRHIYRPEHLYIFISDDIQSIQDEFSYLQNKLFSKEDEITDFQLMQNAQTCVISNSTFSWWAAYLNATPNKKVYCPKYFLGHLVKKEYPVNIYPKSWEQIEVR